MNGVELRCDDNLNQKENSYPAYENANFYNMLNNIEI